MGKVTVYIRVEDEDEWAKLTNKSEFISEALRGRMFKQVKIVEKVTVATRPTNEVVKVNKSNPDINVMFEQWATITGVPINGQQQANRRACSNLLKKYGTEKLKQLIQGVAKAQSQDFAPQIANFTQLQAKQDSLILWGRKQAQEENNSEVVKI